MREAVVRALGGIRWYLKQATGEAKWDEYVEHCTRSGHEPMSRRAFERLRADEKEGSAASRCC